MVTEIQFAGDHNAFPLWGREDSGYFDVNLPGLRRNLSAGLVAHLDEWAQRWAAVDGGEAEHDEALAEELIAEARRLANFVREELGPEYVVSARWDDLAR